MNLTRDDISYLIREFGESDLSEMKITDEGTTFELKRKIERGARRPRRLPVLPRRRTTPLTKQSGHRSQVFSTGHRSRARFRMSSRASMWRRETSSVSSRQ